MYSQLTVGERLRIARKDKGLTQEELGEVISVGKSQISNIEKGTSELTRANAIVLSGKLGITLDWLLHGEGKGPDEKAGTTFTDNKIKGNSNVQGYGNTTAPVRDEECRQELAKAREDVELWRNKYIALLEEMRKP